MIAKHKIICKPVEDMLKMLAPIKLTILSSLLCITVACPSGQVREGARCVPCKPGTYRLLGTKEKCVPCPPGTYQPFAGVRVADLCKYCGPGTFSANSGAANCTTCPPGTTSQRNATRCSRCPPNTKHVSVGDGCEACTGAPTPGFNNLECAECPDPPRSGVPGCPSKPSCPINYFYDWPTRSCVLCPHGTVSEGRTGRLIDCKPCPKNTFRFVKHPSGYPGNCLKCPKGTSTKGRGATVCRRPNTQCPKDTFINSKGDCEQCSRGFRYVPKEKRCIRCLANTVSEGFLQTQCKKCPNNLEADSNRFKCGCKRGYFLANETLCEPCPAGGAQMNQGFRGKGCLWCGANSFDRGNFVFVSLKPGSPTCDFCPLGTIPSNSHDQCVKCPQGMTPAKSNAYRWDYDEEKQDFIYSVINAHEICVDIHTGCQSGYRLVETENSSDRYCMQIPCSRNSTLRDLGRNCIGCDLHYILKEDGPGCNYCGDNHVSPGGLATECQKCQPGWNTGSGKCVCDSNKIITTKGTCENCPIGTEAVNIGNGTRACRACPSGTFRQAVYDFRCRNCPRNSVSKKGASKCTRCSNGFIPNKLFRPDECIPVNNSNN